VEKVVLAVYDRFPSFSLLASSDLPFEQINMSNTFITVTDSSYSGQWKLIFFYQKDFTFVCPTEIIAFANLFEEFRRRNTQILWYSTDSELVHWAWRKYKPELRKLPFPLMSGLNRDLSWQLGILDKNSGVAHRALFIIDPENMIATVGITAVKFWKTAQT
jgi:peroxiredoxin (alkyl hydroperoxide reductase subunit C)